MFVLFMKQVNICVSQPLEVVNKGSQFLSPVHKSIFECLS